MLSKFRLPIFRRHMHVAAQERPKLIDEDFQRVFQSQSGARVLAEILHMSDLFMAVPPHASDRNHCIIEGRRELAMMIFEKAGFEAEKLPMAMVADDLRKAAKDGNDERDRTNSDPESEPDPGFPEPQFPDW